MPSVVTVRSKTKAHPVAKSKGNRGEQGQNPFKGTPFEDLLVPIFRAGRRVYDTPALVDVRRRVSEELSQFHPGVKRFVNPHRYPVGLERKLHELRTQLILQARERAAAGA